MEINRSFIKIKKKKLRRKNNERDTRIGQNHRLYTQIHIHDTFYKNKIK